MILSFEDNEEEMLNTVLSALDSGRKDFTMEKIDLVDKLQYRDLTIFLDRREVLLHNKRVELSFTEFEILQLLAKNPGKVFSKEQIYDIVWNPILAIIVL